MNHEGFIKELQDVPMGQENEWVEVDTVDMTEEQFERFEGDDQPVVQPDDSQLGQMLQMLQKKRRFTEMKEAKALVKKTKNRVKNKQARKARKKNRK